MSQINSYEQLVEVVSLFHDTIDICVYLWIPLSDEKEEGNFTDIYTSEPANFLPWFPGIPDGGLEKNNVILDTGELQYFDAHKTYFACTMCDVPTNISFTLLGVCKETYVGM